MQDEKALWEKCTAFHGHVCGGLMIGFKAALYAEELLKQDHSGDEQMVCISENDACGVDAVQVISGCSVGKGNLLFHMTGKQAFSFYKRATGESVRLVLKATPEGMSREQKFQYLQESRPADLFEVMETRLPLPERARIFKSCRCDVCGEIAGEPWIRLTGERKLCIDCYGGYKRFDV